MTKKFTSEKTGYVWIHTDYPDRREIKIPGPYGVKIYTENWKRRENVSKGRCTLTFDCVVVSIDGARAKRASFKIVEPTYPRAVRHAEKNWTTFVWKVFRKVADRTMLANHKVMRNKIESRALRKQVDQYREAIDCLRAEPAQMQRLEAIVRERCNGRGRYLGLFWFEGKRPSRPVGRAVWTRREFKLPERVMRDLVVPLRKIEKKLAKMKHPYFREH